MQLVGAVVLGSLTCVTAVAAFAGDPSGTWAAEFDTPFGHVKYAYQIKVDGVHVTGTLRSAGARTRIREGRLVGEKISFVELVDFGGQTFRIEYEGTLLGDEIHFTRRVGDFGSNAFVARRVDVNTTMGSSRPPAHGPFPFQDPVLGTEERIANILSLMTLDEKIACLGARADVPRLGIRGTSVVEGRHGLAMGGPGGWNRPLSPVPTTAFPQAIGLAATWDPGLLRTVGAIEGEEARYLAQSEEYGRGGLIVRAPSVDLASDPRCGRTEETYGEDPFLAGAMAAAFIHGLQGDHPRYWRAASLLAHLDALGKDGCGCPPSGLDGRLLREYSSVPFRRAIVEGGANAFMGADALLDAVAGGRQPVLCGVSLNEPGFDGIISRDGDATRRLGTERGCCRDAEEEEAASVKAGMALLPEGYREAIRGALKRGLLTEAEIDGALRGTFRVMIRLGLLDPPSLVPYAGIGADDEPWLSEKQKAAARLVTLKSIVLLKSSQGLLPLDRSALRSVAVIGPHASGVLLDRRSGSPPYTVSPLEGIRSRLGPGVRVGYAVDNTNDTAAILARSADVAVVVVGDDPTCSAGRAECPRRDDGGQAGDRQALVLEHEDLIRQVHRANPRTVVVLVTSSHVRSTGRRRTSPPSST